VAHFLVGSGINLLVLVKSIKNDWAEDGQSGASDIAPIKMVRSWSDVWDRNPFSAPHIEKGRSPLEPAPYHSLIYTSSGANLLPI